MQSDWWTLLMLLTRIQLEECMERSQVPFIISDDVSKQYSMSNTTDQ